MNILVKKMSRLIFILSIAIHLPIIQTRCHAQALNLSTQQKISQLRLDLNQAQSKIELLKSEDQFLKSLTKKDQTFLNESLTYETQLKVNSLLETLETGSLTSTEIRAEIQNIAKLSLPTGAAWEGRAVLEGTVAILLLIGLVSILTHKNTVYELNDCDVYNPNSYCYQTPHCEFNPVINQTICF